MKLTGSQVEAFRRDGYLVTGGYLDPGELDHIRACYDESKRCAETLFFDYHRSNGVDIRVTQPAFRSGERHIVFEMARFGGQQTTVEAPQLYRQARCDSREPFARARFDQRADQ